MKNVQIHDQVYQVTDDTAKLTEWNQNRVTLEILNHVEGVPVRDMNTLLLQSCTSLRDISFPMLMDELPIEELKTLPNLENIFISPLHEEYSSCSGVLYNKKKTVLLDCPQARKDFVRLPQTVRRIEDSAFEGCTKLKTVLLPEGLETIEDRAFHGCRSLHVLNIPDSVSFVGKNAFSGCRQLKELYIPAGLEELPLLDTCASLSKVYVSPENPVFASYDGAVYNKDKSELIYCPRAKSVALLLPKTVTSMDPAALNGCGEIEYIKVPEENPCYCDVKGVLYSKDRTTLLFCPAAYSEPLVLGKEVELIGEDGPPDPGVFGTRVLPIMTFGEDGRPEYFWIEGGAFPSVEVDPENREFSSSDGVLYSKAYTELFRCAPGMKGRVKVLDMVRIIWEEAFCGCSHLTDIELNEGLESIEQAAFRGCFSLKTLTIPKTVRCVERDAFVGCHSLERLCFLGKETKIDSQDFSGCPNLTVCAPPDSIAARKLKDREDIRFEPLAEGEI